MTKTTIPATTNMDHNRKTAWSGKVLIPMWTIQILSTLAIIIGYIWFLATYNQLDYAYYYYDTVTKPSVYTQLHVPEKTACMLTICENSPSTNTFAFISGVIFLILWFIALSVIVFQIVRFHKKNLPAKTMLTMQIILSVFATVALIIEVMGLFFIVMGGIKNLMDFFGTIIAT
jgi:hypothetical protein